MRVNIWLMTVLSLTIIGSGCSRMRAMTRRDYAELGDPFLGSGTALADNSADGTSTGVVRLGGPAGSATAGTSTKIASYENRMAEQNRTAASQSRNSKSAGNDDVPGGHPRTTAGSVASKHNGPSLSDFVGKAPPAKTAAAPEIATARTTTSAPAVATADLADFGLYLKEQAAATRTTAPKTVTAADSDFAEWAAEWDDHKQTATQANHAVQSTRSHVTQAAQTMRHAVKESTPSLPAPVIADDVAAPLISKPPVAATATPDVAAVAVTTPSVAAAQPLQFINSAQPSPKSVTSPPKQPGASAFKGEPNSFAAEKNPFASPDAGQPEQTTAAPAQPTQASPAKPKTLDAMFNFDSGWRPSYLTHP